MATGEDTAKAPGGDEASPWAVAPSKLRYPAWAEQAEKMTTNPRTHRVLPAKRNALVLVGLHAPRTNLNQQGTRRHIRAASAAGATRQEILFSTSMTQAPGVIARTRSGPAPRWKELWKF